MTRKPYQHRMRLDLAARDMTHAVQFHARTLDGQGCEWRVIALFDCERAALGYADECMGDDPDNAARYRVLILT